MGTRSFVGKGWMRWGMILLFMILSVYAGAILGAALVIAIDSVAYSYFFVVTGFDPVEAGHIFAFSTRHFGTMSDAAKIGALCPGLLVALWVSWHAIVKGVNPFHYLWKRKRD